VDVDSCPPIAVTVRGTSRVPVVPNGAETLRIEVTVAPGVSVTLDAFRDVSMLSPETESDTTPPKLLKLVKVIVEVAKEGALTVIEVGLDQIPK